MNWYKASIDQCCARILQAKIVIYGFPREINGENK